MLFWKILPLEFFSQVEAESSLSLPPQTSSSILLALSCFHKITFYSSKSPSLRNQVVKLHLPPSSLFTSSLTSWSFPNVAHSSLRTCLITIILSTPSSISVKTIHPKSCCYICIIFGPVGTQGAAESNGEGKCNLKKKVGPQLCLELHVVALDGVQGRACQGKSSVGSLTGMRNSPIHAKVWTWFLLGRTQWRGKCRGWGSRRKGTFGGLPLPSLRRPTFLLFLQ